MNKVEFIKTCQDFARWMKLNLGDPRQNSRIIDVAVVPFSLPPLYQDEDIYGFLSLGLSVTGLLLKHCQLSWIGLLAAIISWMNQRKGEADARQSIGSIS